MFRGTLTLLDNVPLVLVSVVGIVITRGLVVVVDAVTLPGEVVEVGTVPAVMVKSLDISYWPVLSSISLIAYALPG